MRFPGGTAPTNGRTGGWSSRPRRTPTRRAALLDADDDALLEGSRGNLFLVRDGVLLTPPADGRLLPGVTRARVIELAGRAGIEVREEPLAFERLAEADEAS